MNRTLRMWRRSCGACVLTVGAACIPAVCLAQSTETPPAQAQPVDAGTKKLMAANGLYSRGLYKLAADEYSEFLDQYPDHTKATAARYALAVCRYRLREFDKAVEQLRRVLQDAKFDQRDEALAVLGHCELSQNHYDPAVTAFDELLAKYPGSKQTELATLSRAQVLYLAGKYADSVNACQGYLSRYPEGSSRADALYFLGLAQRGMNQNDAAVGSLAQLLQTYPDSVHKIDALLVSGQALEAAGKLDQAVDAYRQMLAAAPDSRKPDALYSLGIALYKAGKYEAAAQELSKLVNGYATSSFAKPARLQLGLAELAAGQTSPARDALNAVVAGDPDRAVEARYGLAQCDIADKNYDQARGRLEELLQVQPAPPNVAQITLDHAVCTMELGRFQDAADELQNFRGRYPNASQIGEATYRQAFCLHKLGKYQQSHDLCLEVLKLKAPEIAAANAELDAEDLFLLGNYADAQKQFAALADSTKDPHSRLRFIFRQGQCEYFAAHYPQAVQLLAPLASDPRVEQDKELQQMTLLLGDAFLQQGKYAEALPPLKQYLLLPSADRPQALYKLGIAALHTNDAATAREAFSRATEGPTDSQWVQRAWFERGQLDLKDKHDDEAADAFGRVLASNAPPEVAAPAAYQLGWAHFEAKQYPQAASTWKELAAKYPKDKLAADADFQQGVALRQAGQLKDASDVLQEYASAHPDGQYVIKARQLAAACLKEMGKNDQAEKMLASLAGQATGAGADSVLYDLAWSQRDAKETADAEATYRRLIQEHADSKLLPAARSELAELLYNDKRYDESAKLLEQVVNDKSADAKIIAIANYRLGWCYEQLKKPDLAAATFAAYTEKAAGNDEMLASALVQEGLSYAADSKYDKAEQSFAQMLSRFPAQKDAPVAMLKLGEVQAEQNKYDASQHTYEQFLQKYPGGEFAYRAQFGVGWAMENQKHYDEARAAYQKAIGSTNGQTAARAQFQIGETFLAEGKFEPAVRALLAVESVYNYPQWSARALFEAGRAFEQLKRLDEARKEYTEIVAKYKDSPEAEMARDRLKSIAGVQ